MRPHFMQTAISSPPGMRTCRVTMYCAIRPIRILVARMRSRVPSPAEDRLLLALASHLHSVMNNRDDADEADTTIDKRCARED